MSLLVCSTKLPIWYVGISELRQLYWNVVQKWRKWLSKRLQRSSWHSFVHRRQFVIVNVTRSSHRNRSFEVPQRSLLVQRLFILCTMKTSLGVIGCKHELNLCWWDTVVHRPQGQQYGIVRPNHRRSSKLYPSYKNLTAINMWQLNMFLLQDT